MRLTQPGIAACLFLGLAACGERKAPPATEAAAAATPTPQDSANQLRGFARTPPKPLPDIVLTDTDGKRFDLRKETAGYATLLFFGYTHCPDVCPVHMANIARALKGMPAPEAGRIKVVFITTDPERDTAKRIRDWLDTFDPTFIGLRGTPEELLAAQTAMNMPPAQKEAPRDSTRPGDYGVGHAAFVSAATPDGLIRYLYPFGFRQSDWAHDLPLLAGFRPVAVADAGTIVISRAYAFAPPSTDEAAAYFTAANAGTTPDTLLSISSPDAKGASLHRSVQEGNRVTMQSVGATGIAPGDSLVLAPGGAHLMLNGLRSAPRPGDTMHIMLRFARSGELSVALPVRAYGDTE